jgi:hypothetical protein
MTSLSRTLQDLKFLRASITERTWVQGSLQTVVHGEQVRCILGHIYATIDLGDPDGMDTEVCQSAIYESSRGASMCCYLVTSLKALHGAIYTSLVSFNDYDNEGEEDAASTTIEDVHALIDHAIKVVEADIAKAERSESDSGSNREPASTTA